MRRSDGADSRNATQLFERFIFLGFQRQFLDIPVREDSVLIRNTFKINITPFRVQVLEIFRVIVRR